MKKSENSEKTIERKFAESIKEMGGKCLKLYCGSYGLPDRLILMPWGKAYFAEIKSTGQKPRPIQAYWHNLLRDFGFYVWVIDRIEQIDKVLQIIKGDVIKK